jgi:tetratricopeptide (TPR) repeat protein
VNEAPKERRQEKEILLLFFLLILLWQVVFNSFLQPQRVFLKYPINALRLLSHFHPDERWVDFSPLYLCLHAFIIFLNLDSSRIMPILQIFMANVALVLCYRTLRGLVSQRAALLTVLLAALYPTFTLYTFCLEPEALLFLVNMAGIYFTVASPRPLTSGVFFALSFLIRPSSLPLVVASGFLHKQKKWLYFIPAAVGLILLLLFSRWTTGAFTLAYMSPGTVFYEGNNPHADGVAAQYPPVIKLWELEFSGRQADYAHVLYRKASAFEADHALSLSEHHLFWLRKALAYMVDQPMAWGRPFLRKLWMGLSNWEIHDLFSLIMIEQNLKLFNALSFGVFSSLGLLGLLFLWRRVPLLVCLGSLFYLCTLALFYFSSRQRMALFAFMLFLTAFGLEALSRNRRLWGLAAALYAMTLLPPSAIRQHLQTYHEIYLARQTRKAVSAAREAGDWRTAAAALALSLKQAPYQAYSFSSPFLAYKGGSPYAEAIDLPGGGEDPYNMGLLYFFQMDYANALDRFESIRCQDIKKHYYAVEPPLYYIIVCKRHLNMEQEAQADLQEALRRFPGNGPILALDSTRGGGRSLTRYFDLLSAHYYSGRAYFHLERYSEAREYFKEMLEVAPELTLLHEYLGVCEAFDGDLKAMCDEVNFIFKRGDKAFLMPQWQIVLGRLEQEHSGQEDLKECLGKLRTLFPTPVSLKASAQR